MACSTPLIACRLLLMSCHSEGFHSVTRFDCHRLLPCQEAHKVTPAAVLDKLPAALCKGSAVDKRQALHPSPSELNMPAKIQGNVLVHLKFHCCYFSGKNTCRNSALSTSLDVLLYFSTSATEGGSPRYKPPCTSPERAIGSCC